MPALLGTFAHGGMGRLIMKRLPPQPCSAVPPLQRCAVPPLLHHAVPCHAVPCCVLLCCAVLTCMDAVLEEHQLPLHLLQAVLQGKGAAMGV